MIFFDDVYKRYIVDHVPGKWVLQGVSLVIPRKACVGVIGSKGSGKSTLLRLIAGTEPPSAGKIKRDGRVATPLRYNQNFQPLLSGRQNAKFICRINGYTDEMEDRLLRIEKLAVLGAKFDKPLGTYTPSMKSSLSFALSMAFDFDIYISDGFNFAGEIAFKDKSVAEAELKNLIEHAGIIMTAKGEQGVASLKKYCKAGIWLHEGRAKWFDDINDAIEAHKANQTPATLNNHLQEEVTPVTEHSMPLVARIKWMQNALAIFMAGLKGSHVTVGKNKIPKLLQAAKVVGMELATRKQISELGYRMRPDEFPIMQELGSDEQQIEYFDLVTQCDEVEPPEDRRNHANN